MTALYVVRDNCLHMIVSEPSPREAAGRLATDKTSDAARIGEPVSTPTGGDRFTVERSAA